MNDTTQMTPSSILRPTQLDSHLPTALPIPARNALIVLLYITSHTQEIQIPSIASKKSFFSSSNEIPVSDGVQNYVGSISQMCLEAHLSS